VDLVGELHPRQQVRPFRWPDEESLE